MAVSAASGGGLDVETIVSQLMTLEKRPLSALDKQISKQSANANYLSTFKSKASAFEASLAAMRDSTRIASTKVSSSDAVAVTATATSAAAVGDIEVKVVRTAQANRVAFNGFADTAQKFAAGTSFSLGLAGKTVSIDTSGLDLTEIVTKFNTEAANATAPSGVVPLKASLVQTGTGVWSVVVASSETGSSNAITATPTPVLGDKSMVQVQEARDARVFVNGLEVTSASNKLDNVIPGVVIQLRKPVNLTGLTEPVDSTALASVVVSVESESADIRTLAANVVSSFNGMQDYYKSLTKTSLDPSQRGPMSGDSSLAAMMTRTRSLLAEGMTLNGSTTPFRFADMGIELKSNGNLSLNETSFSKALTDGLATKLASIKSISLDTYLGKMVLSTGELGLKEANLVTVQAALQKRKDQLEDRLVLVEASLRSRYSSLDSTLYKLNGINTSLKSALDALSNNNNK